MTDYYPVKKAFALTREEVSRLRVGDRVVLSNRTSLTVKAVGRRWIQTDHHYIRIDLNTGLTEKSNTGHGGQYHLFRSIEDVDIVQYNSIFVRKTCDRLRELLSSPQRISVEQAITLDYVLKGMGIKL